MPFVLKNSEGEYVKGKNAWSVTMISDLSDARVYPTTGAARNSLNQQGRYNRSKKPDLEVVEVQIVEVNT